MKKKNRRREGKRSGVSEEEEDTPKPETENLRYVRRVNRKPPPRDSPTPEPEDDLSTDDPNRPPDDTNDWQCITVGTKAPEKGKKAPTSAARKDADIETMNKYPTKIRRDKHGRVIVDTSHFKTIWVKRYVHTDDSHKNFLNKIGAKVSKATEAKRLKRRQFIAKTFPGIPPGYYPLKGLKTDARVPGFMRKCASLALADYNGQAHTDYRFVDVETVGWQLVSGTKYSIRFRAMANGQYHTFEAEVIRRRVGRLEKREACAISVLDVMMIEPKSIRRSGTLQELIN